MPTGSPRTSPPAGSSTPRTPLRSSGPSRCGSRSRRSTTTGTSRASSTTRGSGGRACAGSSPRGDPPTPTPSRDDDAATDAWFGGYLAGYEASWRTLPGAHEALDEIAQRHPGVRFGVVTNGERSQQEPKIAAVGMTGRLSPVVCSGDLEFTKPDPRIFLLACGEAGVDPADAVMVGDRLRTDALGAADAGLAGGIWLDPDAGSADPARDPAGDPGARLAGRAGRGPGAGRARGHRAHHRARPARRRRGRADRLLRPGRTSAPRIRSASHRVMRRGAPSRVG
ncbi:HAD family hydrolase [Clavibacter zhangzhiyongii]|uniref:HAD family hydrolase n=1 Tax=Clavibacter zhangzhiyongii TaxID=2768071 RepID=UPI0039E0E43C